MIYTYKLSVVVLVYNLEKYLPRCLDSLISQTLEQIEIICIDDGSTDSAPQIIENYKKNYPEKIKVFQKNNQGEFSTRNYGLEIAKGEYITFVDTDDYVEKNWAEKLYNAAKQNNSDMAVCGFERIDSKTGKVIAKNMNNFGNLNKNVNSNDDFLLFINPAPWNKIYKTKLIKDFRFLPIRCFNDALFLITSFINIKRITFIDDILYHYYLRYDSQIHTIKRDDIDNLKKYLLEVKKTYKEYEKYEEYKQILDMMAFLHLAVSAMYRLSYNKKINIKEELKNTIVYLDHNFPTWMKSDFMKFNYCFKKGFKHIALYGVVKLYKFNIPIVYIKIYRFMVDILKIDIKF